MRGLAAAGLLLTLAACGGGAGPAGSTTAPAASGPAGGGAGLAAEVTSPSLPLKLRVTGVHRIAGDVVRVEMRLTNAAAPDAVAPDAVGPGTSPALPLAAAVKALDGLSVLSGDGRRRVFALRTPDGEPVGTPPEVPPPGESRIFWAAFPLAAGPIRVAAPGFPVVAGLEVAAAAPGQPEP